MLCTGQKREGTGNLSPLFFVISLNTGRNFTQLKHEDDTTLLVMLKYEACHKSFTSEKSYIRRYKILHEKKNSCEKSMVIIIKIHIFK